MRLYPQKYLANLLIVWLFFVTALAGCSLEGVSGNDEARRHCIQEAYQASARSRLIELATSMDMRIADGRNQRIIVRTEDPKKEIWLIESAFDRDNVTSTGKSADTVVAYSVLFDITTGKVLVPPEISRVFMMGGDDVSDWSLDLAQHCPELVK